MHLKGIGPSLLVSKDIKKTIKFYTENLGFSVDDFNEQFGWAQLKAEDGSTIGVIQENPFIRVEGGGNAIVSLLTDDVEKAREELVKKNVNLIGDILNVPGKVKLQFFKDEDGNTFQFTELPK